MFSRGTLGGLPKVIDDNSEVSTSSMVLVLLKPLIVSSQPLWRPSGLEKGWRMGPPLSRRGYRINPPFISAIFVRP